jgi:thiol-disulfide isomerase/thioredoxin
MLSADIFQDIENAEKISQVDFNTESLKGKVIFFEYWGVYCPPCKASFPHLVELQKKYAKTGKFIVIASHVQSDKNKAIAFLKFSKVNFPVFQQFRSKEAPCGNSIPHAFLIDHTGKIIEEGHPASLYNKIDALLKKAPVPPSPLFKGVTLNYWKSLEKDITTTNYATIVKKLKNASITDTPKGAEAKEIITVFEANLQKELDSLKEKSNKYPFEAIKSLQEFTKKTKGLDVGTKAKAYCYKLQSDPNLKKIQSLQKEVDKIIKKIRGHRSKVLFKKSKKIKIKLTLLRENNKTSEQAKNAAGNLIDYIDNQI